MPDAPIVVRLARETDAESLRLMNCEFNECDVPEEVIAESLGLSDELVAVASYGDELVGFACAQSHRSFCYRRPEGEITELYVRQGHRKKGVASALITFLEEKLKERDVQSIKVLTGEDNEAGKRTYTRLGYESGDDVVFHKTVRT